MGQAPLQTASIFPAMLKVIFQFHFAFGEPGCLNYLHTEQTGELCFSYSNIKLAKELKECARIIVYVLGIKDQLL